MYADTVAVIRLLFLKYFELPLLPIGVMSKRKRQVKVGIYDKHYNYVVVNVFNNDDKKATGRWNCK